MELPDPTSPLESGISRARQIERDIVARLAEMRVVADQRDDEGRLTKPAKIMRQRLQNPDLSTTTLKVALNSAAAVQADLVEKARLASLSLIRAEAAYAEALAALHFHALHRELFEEKAQSGQTRKRELSADQVSVEEMNFLLEMRRRDVPVSAMDQGNGYERDFIAFFLRDLAKPIDKRSSTGAWARTFSQGALNMPVLTMTEDEAEALRIVWSRGYDDAVQAKRSLEEVAGRQLDINLSFAQLLVGASEHYDLDQLDGLKKNLETAEALTWSRAKGALLKMLDLSESDLESARNLLNDDHLMDDPARVAADPTARVANENDPVASDPTFRHEVDPQEPSPALPTPDERLAAGEALKTGSQSGTSSPPSPDPTKATPHWLKRTPYRRSKQRAPMLIHCKVRRRSERSRRENL